MHAFVSTIILDSSMRNGFCWLKIRYAHHHASEVYHEKSTKLVPLLPRKNITSRLQHLCSWEKALPTRTPMLGRCLRQFQLAWAVFVNKGWSLHLWPRSCWECRWLPSGFLCLYCLCSQWCFGLVRLWKSRGAIPFVEDPGIPNFDSQLTTCEIPLNTRLRYLGIWLRTPRSSTWNQTEEFTMPKIPTRPKKILVSKRLLQKNTLFKSKNMYVVFSNQFCSKSSILLLMEDILHHLRYIKPLQITRNFPSQLVQDFHQPPPWKPLGSCRKSPNCNSPTRRCAVRKSCVAESLAS